MKQFTSGGISVRLEGKTAKFVGMACPGWVRTGSIQQTHPAERSDGEGFEDEQKEPLIFCF